MSAKTIRYEALGRYLKARSYQATVPMTFDEIERLVGGLPASKRYPAWWSNNPSNNPMTRVWLDAGFHTEQVDIAGEKLVFRKTPVAAGEAAKVAREIGFDEVPQQPRGMAEEPRAFEPAPEQKPRGRHPLIGAMKGTFTIEPGWDLTRPSLDPEELDEWEASLDRKADLIDQGMSGKRK